MKAIKSYSIEEKIAKDFDAVCSKNCMNKSLVIESLLAQFLTKLKKKEL